MKILQLTAGTGSFYCGNCIRDNTLVRHLRKLGHDVLMVPLYLPIIADDPDGGANAPLFFGGVNAYLQQKHAFFRKTPRFIDKFFDLPFIIKQAAKKVGMTQAKDLGDMSLSMLKGEQGNQSKELKRLIDWLKNNFQPDVINLSNGLLIGMARRLKQETGAKVFCTLQGSDTFIDALPSLWREQSWAEFQQRAAEIDGLISVSHYYTDVMKERLAVADEKIFTVPNGIETEGHRPIDLPHNSRTIGFLSRLHHAKGLDHLVDAFILLKQKSEFDDVQLKLGGSQTEPDNAYVETQKKKLEQAKLLDQVEFCTNMHRPEKLEFLHSLTVLSVPALYGEAFGLYVIEALASGVPVVEPRHAALPEIVEATGGGILYDDLTPQGLANALGDLLSNPEQLKKLSEQGRKTVLEKYNANIMAENVLKVFTGN